MSASTRDAILGRIRRANGGRPHDPERQSVVDERLAGKASGVVPQRGQLPHEEKVGLFIAMAEKVHATTARISGYDELPAEVSRWLRENNFPADLRICEDPRIAGADFDATALTIRRGASDGNDINALSHAEAAIAETGTLCLVSGPENPTSLNFLPENHVVVLRAADVEGDMEALFPALRQRYGEGKMPRSVNFITGPSRSGDIEQVLLLGAHGPRALHIVIVD
jgi:L-lactate dehydrogenase complex protein LldG